jgi:hypothetical protein
MGWDVEKLLKRIIIKKIERRVARKGAQSVTFTYVYV